jgi:HD-GYP domain-containing protein (c-di-GMP phosphodiesterase class II)
MTTNRPYHQAESLETAYAHVLEMSGKYFDPSVVQAFHRVWESGKVQQIAALWPQKISPA